MWHFRLCQRENRLRLCRRDLIHLGQSIIDDAYTEDLDKPVNSQIESAEQKLFNLKSIIVPIPRTHDQKLNAEWYVKNFNDIMVEQSQPTTSQDLLNALVSLKDYHKPEISTNILAEI